MSTTSLIIAIDKLRKQLEICEDFSDWEGCEIIEEQISVLEAILEEKSLALYPLRTQSRAEAFLKTIKKRI
jgi:hypothetical protein